MSSLVLQTVYQVPDGVVVNGTEEERGPLAHVHVDVVHGGDDAAEGVGQHRPHRRALLHRPVLQEAEDEGGLLDGGEAYPPVVVREVVVEHAPEDLGSGGQRQRVQDEGDRYLRTKFTVLFIEVQYCSIVCYLGHLGMGGVQDGPEDADEKRFLAVRHEALVLLAGGAG